jgi:ATP-binding cassette subfamily C protein CydD
MALATGVRHYIAGVVAARLAVTATFVVQGVLLAAVLERLLDGEAVGDQAGLLVGVGVVVVVRFGLTWLGEVVGQLTASATKQDLRTRAFAKLAELGPAPPRSPSRPCGSTASPSPTNPGSRCCAT